MDTTQTIANIRAALGGVIRGQGHAIDLLLVAILSGGHVLFEDVPGVGKTTLAKALAKALGLGFSRIQFTPDLLPTDILGASVLNPQDGTFAFHEGPIFAHIVLADEINRASPRTQSALLEAMNEGQATVDGQTRLLAQPFFVIATQNPIDYQGTYPLPEAQLDRFSMRIAMGYPDANHELKLIFDRQKTDPLLAVSAALEKGDLLALQKRVRDVRVSEEIGHYLLTIVRATRDHPELELGASPRAALALFRAVQARALIAERDWVGPADVQALCSPVLAHRLVLTVQAKYSGKSAASFVEEIVASQQVPK